MEVPISKARVSTGVGFAMPHLIHYAESSRLLKPETDDCIHSVLVLGHPRRAGSATAAAAGTATRHTLLYPTFANTSVRLTPACG